MYRLLVLVILVSQWTAVQPFPVVAQETSDGEAAASVAVELSALEASGDFNTLFDRIHPDARADIPRAAVIGWYQNEFAPRGPGVATVTGVQFVSWTWPVTGETYPYTAEVSFQQPFADGTVVEDVVRLVQDRNGEWRWFFGRSREFVNEQIAIYVPPVPVVTQNESIISAVMRDIDMYWAMSFAATGMAYSSPLVVDISQGGISPCGYIAPNEGPGFYCALDQTIYISIDWFVYYDGQIGDFAWITILAHEWGHHVQSVSGSHAGAGNKYELQADCLAGSYALDADTRGLLHPGDVTEGVAAAASAGDAPGFPQDQPGSHGTSDERVTSFMRGYLDGFIGCQFIPGSNQQTQSLPVKATTSVSLPSLLPQSNDVPSDLQHSGDRDRSLADVAANYTNPTETESQFTQWGWSENVTRSYDGTGRESGLTSVYTSIHRFRSSQDAVSGLHYSVADQMMSTGAWEVPVEASGETTRALATSSDVTIYAQQGDVLVRLTVSSLTGDPMTTAQGIMNAIIARAR